MPSSPARRTFATRVTAAKHGVRFATIVALAGLAAPPLASAQAGLQAQADECARLARAKDYAAAAACQKKMMRQAMDARPANAPQGPRENRAPSAADTTTVHEPAAATQPDANAETQRALDCTTLNTEATDGPDYAYRLTNNCDRPVTVHLCLAEGPQQPSRKRDTRLPPGESVRWVFAKRGRYEPMTVYNACFKAEQCITPGPVACRDA